MSETKEICNTLGCNKIATEKVTFISPEHLIYHCSDHRLNEHEVKEVIAFGAKKEYSPKGYND